MTDRLPPVPSRLEAILHTIRGWFNGTASARVDALYERATAETEAVSQEAKALRNDCRRLTNNPDAFDALIRDMLDRRNATSLGQHH
jgi:hypothetical protein